MVDPLELNSVIEGLMKEHDSLLQEREVARQQEESSKNRREELDRKIAGIQQSLQGLSLYSTAKDKPTELTHDLVSAITSAGNAMLSGITNKTLTDCCRDILKTNGGWMSAILVRQGLHAAGFDFSEYKSNPLSSIHTTLKRIAESGQAWTRLDTTTNDNLYRWKRDGETGQRLR